MPHDIGTHLLRNLQSGSAFSLSDPTDPRIHAICGLDGRAEIGICPASLDVPACITLDLTDSGVGAPASAVVSFDPDAALALAHAVIAQVGAIRRQFAAKEVPGCPGGAR